jgi:glycosyltransferase involved in cell wall biosynthesis
MSRRIRLLKLVNIIAPYRVCVYNEIGKHVDFTVAYGGNESNRGTWVPPARDEVSFTPLKSKGITLRIPRKGSDGKTVDTRFIQLTFGFLFDLVRLRPDAVLSVEMGFRSLCALMYGSLFRKPVWIWWGGTLHTEREVGGFKLKLRKFFVKRARHWISYGATSTEYLTSIGVDRNRIVQIQNCVDYHRFSPSIEASMKDLPGPVLLHVGQLIGRKGVEGLIRAYAEASRRANVRGTLLLVGDGPDRQALEALCTELQIRDSVLFEGARKPAALPGIYRSADVVIFPTLEDVWGLVANEAMLCGVPVLVSKFAGCAAEIVHPDAVFDPLDHEAMVARLVSALQRQTPLSDASHLLSFEQVAGRIVDSVKKEVRL